MSATPGLPTMYDRATAKTPHKGKSLIGRVKTVLPVVHSGLKMASSPHVERALKVANLVNTVAPNPYLKTAIGVGTAINRIAKVAEPVVRRVAEHNRNAYQARGYN